MIEANSVPVEQILFCGEDYNLQQFTDGSKRIFKDKNERGFKINIKVSGDPEEHRQGMQALKDFYKRVL